MNKSLKDIVKEAMDLRGVSVLELSRQTGIPSARIYKWYKEGHSPKSGDEKVLQSWLDNLEETINPTIKNPDISQDYREKFYQLLEKNSKLEEKIEANSKTMEGNMIHLTDLILQGQDDIIQKIGNELSQRLEALEKSLVSSLKVAPGKKPVQKGKH